jgi:hypothetical protein
MRLGMSLVVLLTSLTVLGAQDAPDVRYWPLREINFPVPLEKLTGQALKPTKLHFYVSDRGAWKKVDARGLNDLEVIDVESKRKGFRFVSPADGTYDFALQLEYANGELQPRDTELSSQYRVIFDTRPPLVRVARLGRTGIDWEVVDENLGPGAIAIEARWVGDTKFSVITPRNFTPKTRDSYTWTNIPPNDTMEVRIVARDRANLETVSPVIRLPGDGNAPGLPAATPGSGFGNPAEFNGGGATGGTSQPQIDYSKTWNLKITSKLQKVTRSGVTKSHLWMRDQNSSWAKVKEQPEVIPGTATDPIINMDYVVNKDGRYGFIIVPENGAGNRDPDPKGNDPAQFLIEVDTKAPDIEVLTAAAYGMGATGPRVEITWKASDLNLTQTPIKLEYGDTPSGPWKQMHEGSLPNNGRYVWEVDNKSLWKFHVRARAVDLATNEKIAPYPKEVKIDLDTPKATIEKVEGKGGAPMTPNVSESKKEPIEPVVEQPVIKPVVVPVTPAPAPMPMTEPAVGPPVPKFPG